MASVGERIELEVVDVLAQVGGPSGLNVHRNDYLELQDEAQYPAAVVMAPAEEIEVRDSSLLDRRMTLTVEIRALGFRDTEPSATLDELYLWVVQQITGADRLNGRGADPLAYRIDQTGRRKGSGNLDRIYALMQVDFLIYYQTRVDDPESRT